MTHTQEPAPAPVLQMRGISKRYPGARALTDASLDVRRGEVHIVVGENGAGKSTLMKILSGAVRADAGEIVLDGSNVELDSPLRARSLGISTIYQELSLVPHMSVAENIFLGKTPTRWPGIIDARRMRQEARRILDSLGVSIDCDSPVYSLRLAQQQMVEVARALSDNARILVMDEPTSALSQREVEQLFATIARVTSNGVAVIYISHRMDEVFRIGHRVTVLRDGRHVATRDIEDVTAAELVRLMADREVADHYPRRRHARGDELLRVDRLDGGGLKEISFVLHRGEILGIAGLVGAGRTRLARAIAGADPPSRSALRWASSVGERRFVVRGSALSIDSPADAVRAGIGFLPEDRKQQGLVLPLSVERNISMSHLSALARFGVLDGAKERGEAESAIRSLRIRTPGSDQRVLNLSGGNQQKVVLAKWLAAHADILIFDEPTRGIDVAARQDIYLLMNQLVENGAGLIMISSDLPEVLGMSDRILVMRGGRVTRELAAHEATDAAVLQAALGVPA
jgi:ribose transport system ATP-binding protein